MNTKKTGRLAKNKLSDSLKQISTKDLTKLFHPIKDNLIRDELWINERGYELWEFKKKANNFFNHEDIENWIKKNKHKIPNELKLAFYYIKALYLENYKHITSPCIEELKDFQLSLKYRNLYSRLILFVIKKIKEPRAFTFFKLKNKLKYEIFSLKNKDILNFETKIRECYIGYHINANSKKYENKTVRIFQYQNNNNLFYYINYFNLDSNCSPVDINIPETLENFTYERDCIVCINKKTGELAIDLELRNWTRINNDSNEYLSILESIFFNNTNSYMPFKKFNINKILEKDFKIKQLPLNSISDFKIKEMEFELGLNSSNKISISSKDDTLELFKSLGLKENAYIKKLTLEMLISENDTKEIIIYSDKRSCYPIDCDYNLIDNLLTINGICNQE